MREHYESIVYPYCCILFIISAVSISCRNSFQDVSLSGKWVGIYKNNEVVVIFKDSSICTAIYFNNEMGRNDTIHGNYQLQLSKTPIPLSITRIKELNHSMHTIIEFLDKNTIRMATFSPKWRLRPITFESDNTIILERESIGY